MAKSKEKSDDLFDFWAKAIAKKRAEKARNPEKNWFQRHPVWTIFFVLVIIGQFVSHDKEGVSTKQTFKAMEVEVTPIDVGGNLWKIRNRNDYAWHNVSIIVNKYYSCGNYGNLDPDSSVDLYIAECEEFAYSYTTVSSLKVIATEGTRYFERK